MLVPKGSVVAEGNIVKVSSVEPIKSKLLSWNEFYRKHRASLRFVAITEGQWTGEESLHDLKAKVAQARRSSFTTLTTLRGGFVSLPGLQKQNGPAS